MDTQSFVQQIKQKQEELKKTLKVVHPVQKHKREQSAPENVSYSTLPQTVKHSQSLSYGQSPEYDSFIRESSPPPANSRSKNQTPNQNRVKQQSDTSASPLIFRTPHVSLHQQQLNSSNIRYQQDFSDERENKKKKETMGTKTIKSQIKEKIHRQRQGERPNIKQFQMQPFPNQQSQDQRVIQELQQELYDHQMVLDEVMKKYRALQLDLNQKNRELMKTEFYRTELLKEKARNVQLQERNQMLKNKLLKFIEVVQAHQLEERQMEAEWEVVIYFISFYSKGEKEQQMKVLIQNQALRRALCLDLDVTEIGNQVEYDSVLEETDQNLEQTQQSLSAVDKILNIMIIDLKQIKSDRQRKTSQAIAYNTQSLALTVTNKSGMVDLDEERLMNSQRVDKIPEQELS